MKIEDSIQKDPTLESPETDQLEQIEEQPSGFSLNLDWMKSPTGDGDISEYINHPMNFNRSRGTAQMIRGLTGIFGSMDFAIVDIILGFMESMKERRTAAIAKEY